MTGNILIADDEPDIRESLSFILEKENYNCKTVSNGKEALEELEKSNYDVLISDIVMPELDGMQLLEKASQISPQTLVIIMTAYASVESAVHALRQGAADYLLKPIEFDEVIIRVKQILKNKRLSLENKFLRGQIQKRFNFQNIVGNSSAMKEVFVLIKRVSEASTNVLITGETGTGKELVARAIHNNSERSDQSFIPVNCGAIPDNLYESEFFGYKKGAFTGANENHDGLFKSANGGTLFLDEIGDLPEHVQVKLLRVLQEKEVRAVGSNTSFNIDVRVVAATNKDLIEEVKKGNFREDLFYRLNVVEIHLPSLSERKDDIPSLVDHFVDRYNSELNRKVKGVDNAVMKALMNYEWKGNLRELENIIERAVLLTDSEYISLKELPSHLRPNIKVDSNYPDDLNEALNAYEKQHILNVLERAEWNRTEAAKTLGIDTSTLYRKMLKLEIKTTDSPHS